MALAEVCGFKDYYKPKIESHSKNSTSLDIYNGTYNFTNNMVLELPPFGHVSIQVKFS